MSDWRANNCKERKRRIIKGRKNVIQIKATIPFSTGRGTRHITTS